MILSSVFFSFSCINLNNINLTFGFQKKFKNENNLVVCVYKKYKNVENRLGKTFKMLLLFELHSFIFVCEYFVIGIFNQ